MSEKCLFQFLDGKPCVKDAGHVPPHYSGKYNPTVQGGGDTEPERDVLERLREGLPDRNLYRLSTEQLLRADAIAKIEKLEKHRAAAQLNQDADLKEIARLNEQLRQYTEAEVVWQARKVVYGYAFGWANIHKSQVETYITAHNCEVRSLIVMSKRFNPQTLAPTGKKC